MLQKHIESDCIKLEKQLEILQYQRDILDKQIDEVDWDLNVLTTMLDDIAKPENAYFI